ncbi:MAG: hypothetical protein RL095_2223 [Verrucomicrobiota bacterium]
MPRWKTVLLLLSAWVALHLVNLGVPEFGYDETRRVFPAQAMLESGDWMNPVFEGEAYERKPPLFNWMVCGSFLCFGGSEFSARLPSSLPLLLLVLVLALGRGAWLSPRARDLAALALLASIPCWSQARQCGIDCAYASVSGLALLLWCEAFCGGRRGAGLWLLPGLFLGGALLLKGPAALLLYLLFTLLVLRAAGELKAELKAPGFYLGLALAFSLFAAWLLLRQTQSPPSGVAASSDGSTFQVWWTELSQRLLTNSENGKVFKFRDYLSRSSSGVGSFLPWLLLLPLLWRQIPAAAAPAALVRGGRLAVLIFLAAILLMPLTKGRYLMPALPPLLVIVALQLGLERPPFPRLWTRLQTGSAWALRLLIPTLLAAAIYQAVALWRPLPAAAAHFGQAWGLLACVSLLLLALALRLVFDRSASKSSLLASWKLALSLAAVLALVSSFQPVLAQQRSSQEKDLAARLLALPAREELILCDVGLGSPFLFDLKKRPVLFLNGREAGSSWRFGGQHRASGELDGAQAAERLGRSRWILASENAAMQALLAQLKLEKIETIKYRKRTLGLYRVR